jgi:hypothetical protein
VTSTPASAERIEQDLRERFAASDLSDPVTRALFQLCLARARLRAGLPAEADALRR